MCKFTNHLFVFLLIGLCRTGTQSTVTIVPRSLENTKPFLQLFTDYSDRDQHYDQRQRGKHNVLLKLDTIVLGLPHIPALPNDTGDDENETPTAGSGLNSFYDLDWVIGTWTTEAAGKPVADAAESEANTADRVTTEDESQTRLAIATETEPESDKDNTIIAELDSPRNHEVIESRYASSEPEGEMSIDALTRARWYFLNFLNSLRHNTGY